MNRTQARAAAMKLVYEWDMGGDGGEETCRELLEIRPGEDERDYMEAVFEGVRQSREALDGKIERFARGWKLDRLSKVDLAILRVAAYELAQAREPAGAVIQEAVQLSEKYSSEKAGAFVNGVLGAMVRAGGA
jgi:N utilization substance protein B